MRSYPLSAGIAAARFLRQPRHRPRHRAAAESWAARAGDGVDSGPWPRAWVVVPFYCVLRRTLQHFPARVAAVARLRAAGHARGGRRGLAYLGNIGARPRFFLRRARRRRPRGRRRGRGAAAAKKAAGQGNDGARDARHLARGGFAGGVRAVGGRRLYGGHL
ncbi:hypothetical protein M885DRAFT_131713 [Pelagophyceae sp. CCMP2097]|nr:hypothetical protein M885DRAFT_131713 [Pelagophyceae sp. CCMP2097]